jgi:hypothetical protein
MAEEINCLRGERFNIFSSTMQIRLLKLPLMHLRCDFLQAQFLLLHSKMCDLAEQALLRHISTDSLP